MSKDLDNSTWTEKELNKALKDSRSKDSKHRDKDRRDRESSHHRSSSHKADKEHRGKEDRDRLKEKEKLRDRGDRDREYQKHGDKEKEERRKEKPKDKEEKDRDRHRGRDEKDRDRHRDRDEKDRDRHRDRDEKDRDRHRDRDEKDRDRHRDRDEKDRTKPKTKDIADGERDRRRDRDERDKDKHRERDKNRGDEDREKRKQKEKEKNKDEGYYEKRRDKDKDESRRRDRDDRHHRDRDNEHHRKRTDGSDNKERDHRLHRDGDRPANEKQRNGASDENDTGNHSQMKIEEEDLYSREGKGDGSVVDEKDKDDNYEDDFEDYDDDFDDDGDDEEGEEDIQDVKNTVTSHSNSTYQRDKSRNDDSSHTSSSYSSRKLRSDEKEVPKVDPRAPRALIDFFSARQRTTTSQVSRRTKQRGKELLRLIDLDFTDADLFEQAPLQEYQLYIRSFGRSNTQQQGIQTNGDVWDREMQCEEIELRTLWTQHPPEDMNAVGIIVGDKTNKIATQYTSSHDTLSRLTGDAYLDDNQNIEKSGSLTNSLNIFLCILEEEAKPQVQSSQTADGHKLRFSSGYTSLLVGDNPPERIMKSWPCVAASFSPQHSNLILSLHVSENVYQWPQSFIFVWRVSSAHQGPQEILYSAQRANCAVFSPDMAASQIFLGCDDGSVSLYDLKEPISSHGRITPKLTAANRDNNECVSLLARAPSFIAASSWENEEECGGHMNPVISLQILSTESKWFRPGNRHKASSLNTARGRKSSDTEDESESSAIIEQSVNKYDENNFQVASLDNQGRICIWVVIRIHGNTVDLAGSESDLALRPGSRSRLSKTSMISVSSPFTSWSRKSEELVNWCGEVTTCVTVSPGDTRNFYIGTESGIVIKQSRNESGSRGKLSRWFQPLTPSPVTCLDFHQFGMNLLLVGYEEGSLLLFATSRPEPLLVWPAATHKSSPIRRVLWSRSRPSVFFSLDASGVLSTWDLLKSTAKPVDSIDYGVGGLSLSQDTRAGTGNQSGSCRVLMCLWRQSAAGGELMEAHELSERFSAGSMTEGYEMEKLFDDLM